MKKYSDEMNGKYPKYPGNTRPFQERKAMYSDIVRYRYRDRLTMKKIAEIIGRSYSLVRERLDFLRRMSCIVKLEPYLHDDAILLLYEKMLEDSIDSYWIDKFERLIEYKKQNMA